MAEKELKKKKKKAKKTPTFLLGGQDVKINLDKHLKKFKKYPKRYKDIKVTFSDFSDYTIESYKYICSSFSGESVKNLIFKFGNLFEIEHLNKLMEVMENKSSDEFKWFHGKPIIIKVNIVEEPMQ